MSLTTVGDGVRFFVFMIIKFLGTASNGGVPQIDCRCINCERARSDEKFRRLRSCLAVSENNKDWSIIDCGPDFDRQLENLKIITQDIKSIALTHLHPDHSVGLTEFGFGKIHQVKLNVSDNLKREILDNPMFKHLIDVGFAKFVKSNIFKFVSIKHWPNHSCSAIVFGKKKKILFASDCAEIDNNLLKEMVKVDLIIFDGTFLNESKFNHLAIKESCQILKNLNKLVIFTHINHSENVQEIIDFIKQFKFKIAHDGMEVKI